MIREGENYTADAIDSLVYLLLIALALVRDDDDDENKMSEEQRLLFLSVCLSVCCPSAAGSCVLTREDSTDYSK